MNKLKLKKLFSDMCCSECRHGFDEEAIEIIRQEDEFLVVRVTCPACGKSFGVALLGIENLEIKGEKETCEDLGLKIQPETQPISYDDVLNAHKFIQNLDENWYSELKENLEKR